MTNGEIVPAPIGPRSAVLPVLLLGFAVGIAIGLGLGRTTPNFPPATAAAPPTTAPSTAGSSTRSIEPASVAPDLMQAYYATRQTSAGLAPVVCTTDAGLTCQGVPVHLIASVEGQNPVIPRIPSPDELWLRFDPVHLKQIGGKVNGVMVDDLSPALYSQVVVQVANSNENWSTTTLSPTSVNGAVASIDLGGMRVGRYVLLIRQVLSVPPDPKGLVETWKAITVEVDP